MSRGGARPWGASLLRRAVAAAVLARKRSDAVEVVADQGEGEQHRDLREAEDTEEACARCSRTLP